VTPETLPRHELVGLPVRVADAASDAYVGVAGRVAGESMRTLTVRTPSGDARVPKRGTTFEFELVAESDRTVSTDECGGARTPPHTDECGGGQTPPHTDECGGGQTPPHTDEAAERWNASGSTSELGSDTAGVRPRQSGPSDGDAATGVASASQRGECDGAGYLTVDGTRLLSRPAERTERGVLTWR